MKSNKLAERELHGREQKKLTILIKKIIGRIRGKKGIKKIKFKGFDTLLKSLA